MPGTAAGSESSSTRNRTGDEIAEIVRDVYRTVAPKTLVAELPES